MSDLIVPQSDGTFVVAGVVTVDSREEAEACLAETGVFQRKAWPFERRSEPRVTLWETNGTKPADLCVIHKLEY